MDGPEQNGGQGANYERLLATLELLLSIDATDLKSAMDQATDMLVEALGADKVDVFLHDPPSNTLVAIGTSLTPMGRLQKASGLDKLPVANGGRTVEVFTTGKPFMTGRADLDPALVPGVKETLGVRSMLVVPLLIGGELRGVLSANCAKEDRFTERDLSLFKAVARWIGTIAHRAELAERIKEHTVEETRRATAEELVAVLSHDLGNRITPAIGRVEMIRRQAKREGNERYLASAEAARQSLQRIHELVKDLLDVTRLEQGVFSLTFQQANLIGIAGEAVEMLTANGAEISVRMPEELWVETDPARMHQAIENLLANALKHGPRGVPVALEITEEMRETGKWAIISVRDEGPGIEAALLPKLFLPFSPGPNSAGLGLGLYLVQGIAKAHGGTLTVDSAPSVGTTFLFALPVAHDAQAT